jgi:hypothetical protein
MNEDKKINGDIIRVTYDERSRNYKYEDGYNSLDRRIQIVSIDEQTV